MLKHNATRSKTSAREGVQGVKSQSRMFLEIIILPRQYFVGVVKRTDSQYIRASNVDIHYIVNIEYRHWGSCTTRMMLSIAAFNIEAKTHVA